MQLRDRTAGFVRTEGGLLPPDLLERIRALDGQLPFLDPASYDLERGDRFGEAITRSWNRLVGAWAAFSDELAELPDTDPATSPTRERWLLPLFEELGYGRLSPAKAVEIDGRSYPISHARDTIPLHLVGANVPLDRRSRGVAGAATQSPHGLLQEFLNRTSDRLWGIVSNGRTLRLLRDNASLTRQAYVEFDLEAIFSAEAYADFALLWHLAHRTRLEARLAEGAEEGASPTAHGAIVERWSKIAADTGARARDRLRDGVQEAIEVLGSGFLGHPANGDLRAALQTGELDTQDYYRQLLRLVYRLILLFVAEDRDLLLDPKADAATRERYTRYYSTARLRRLAGRRKGSRHADLYAGLKVVISALGRDEGAPGIGLPPLGGFLFGPEGCPHLDVAELANADLLDAIRKLATIEERGVLRAVDYRNLGSEELGSIYESLLELHPELDVNAGSFALRTAAGHERKTTGSYYTPSSLISVLLDSALDPVVEEAANKPTPEEAERAILELSVVDPAAGSGHFLVAAAHRIAKRLASVRSGDEEPAPEAIRTALRDVIGHCLYAVDINPMAVELCKVSLWLEALEPGKPLTFLDAHIKCGNSLLGTTPELIAQGIPDAAYTPIEGDDKKVAAALKKQNRAEREGQQMAFAESQVPLIVTALSTSFRQADALSDNSMPSVRAKEHAHRTHEESSSYWVLRLAADTWCSAFVRSKNSGDIPTTSDVRAVMTRSPLSELASEDVQRHGQSFFHWPLEFPSVFGSGGFDVVLGNPPWEKIQLEEQQFFAERMPEIAVAKHAAARKRLIAALQETDAATWQEFNTAQQRIAAQSHFVRRSGRYRLTGQGRLNTAALFAEHGRSLLSATGRVGLVLPTGIATDDTTKEFFSDVVRAGQLVSLYDFENTRGIFPAVDSRMKFCLFTVTGVARPAGATDFVFFATDTSELGDIKRHFALTPEDFALLSPNTGTCPTFRSGRDAEVTREIYRRTPILWREGDSNGNPLGVSFLQGTFNMASDSHLFKDEPGESSVPLYEAKLIHQFTHRWATYNGGGVVRRLTSAELASKSQYVAPRYWVSEQAAEERLRNRWGHPWLLGWRDIARATDERTLISAVLPRYAAGNKILLMLPGSAEYSLAVLAVLNSFVVDFAARQKVGGLNVNYFVVKQLPVPPPQSLSGPVPFATQESMADWVRPRVMELTFTAWDLEPFARDFGWTGAPFRWQADRRSLIRAELDAAIFHIYGVPRQHVEHILDSFEVLRSDEVTLTGHFRTKSLILEFYDAMESGGGGGYVSPISPGPGHPSIADGNSEAGPGWEQWETVVERFQKLRNQQGGNSPHQVRSTPRDRSLTGHEGIPAGSRMRNKPSASMDSLFSAATDGAWRSEAMIDPRDLVIGEAIRHPSYGEGVVLGVRDGSKVFVLARFASGEREIAFGYGFLEFRRDNGRARAMLRGK